MNKLLIPQRIGLPPCTARNASKGMIVPTLLIVMLIITTVGLSLASLAIAQLNKTSRNVAVANSLLAAEAGIEFTLLELNADSTYPGSITQEVFFDNTKQGRGTYQTEITDGTLNNEKIITSTGRVFLPADPSQPVAIRSVRAVVVGTTALDYSVHTGPGGLIMSNSATIANGDVHVEGYIDMSNSARIGSSGNPVRVNVPHINCPSPPDSTFPAPCGSGDGEPISITNPAWIYATVRATNQVDGSRMSDSGLTGDCPLTDPDCNVSLPDYDREAHKTAATTSVLNTSANCTGNGTTKTWDANTRITGGDVTVSKSCKVVIEGDVWISDGSLEMRNSGTIQVADGLTERPVIMIDGTDGLKLRNSSTILTNSDGIGGEFVTFYSAAGCSPDCSDVTGVDLHNSQDHMTIDLNNSSLGAGSKFYARWTKIRVNNGGSIGAILGQTIELANSGNISFGYELSSGETVWAIKNYQQIFEHLP